MIEWPSDKVPPGGVFHVKKTTYSKETENLLKGRSEYFEFNFFPI